MLTQQEQTQLIIDCQQKIIDNPVRACVNSESRFVVDLIAEHDDKLAMNYWSWFCSNYKNKTSFGTNETILKNQEKLDAVDKKVVMPDCGYSGT